MSLETVPVADRTDGLQLQEEGRTKYALCSTGCRDYEESTGGLSLPKNSDLEKNLKKKLRVFEK